MVRPDPRTLATPIHAGSTPVVFTWEDVVQFSAASHDRNPLHLSGEYARATPYGEPVVFGILAVLAALGQLPDRPHHRLQSLSVEFRNPLTVGISYRWELSASSTACHTVKLYDASRLMMKATYAFVPTDETAPSLPVPEAPARLSAAERTMTDLTPGTAVKGIYGPRPQEFAQIVTRWGLSAKGATARQLAALMWTSFLVGMELPGTRAVFWRLSLSFLPELELHHDPFSYDAVIHELDERYDLLHTTGTLSSGQTTGATAQMWAFVRRDSPQPSLSRIAELLPRSTHLNGKVALVIGGSRGLGAAITQALASQGCSVVLNYHRSTQEAERIRTSCGEDSARIMLLQGDAADAEWCASARQTILNRYGRLDLLICNASPAIRPLVFAPERLAQFEQFVARSLALVTVPMASFLGLLAEQGGWNIVLSSAFVTELPAEFPQYIATKSAVEGLTRWSALHHPKVRHLIVRPPKLLTDQTNTTMGRQGAMAAEQAAASIVRHICSAPRSHTAEILDTFELKQEPSCSGAPASAGVLTPCIRQDTDRS
ncbi:MAG: SDR family NAD(P)-dependent oxidoreductase [Nitrospira sp.]|nr:SDR family NAD(P)-dependent oxidoreductase [Nitrospira sp.]